MEAWAHCGGSAESRSPPCFPASTRFSLPGHPSLALPERPREPSNLSPRPVPDPLGGQRRVASLVGQAPRSRRPRARGRLRSPSVDDFYSDFAFESLESMERSVMSSRRRASPGCCPTRPGQVTPSRARRPCRSERHPKPRASPSHARSFAVTRCDPRVQHPEVEQCPRMRNHHLNLESRVHCPILENDFQR